MTNPDPRPHTSRASDCPERPTHPVMQHIPARVTTLGQGLTIRRALPSRQRRMIGAWCFFDHAGPLEYEAGEGIAVGPHPHTGLQTFSWMIEGRMRHSDSLGNVVWIEPGQVNLMSAGRGISHAEESDPDQAGKVQLAQLWIALPDEIRNGPPDFVNYPELPTVEREGLTLTVLVGNLGETDSPVSVHSPLLAVDLAGTSDKATLLNLDPVFEHGLMVLEGQATINAQRAGPGELIYLGQGRDRVGLSLSETSRVLLIGGAPFEEDILLWWNFVARTPEEIREFAEAWKSGKRFGSVEASITPPLKMPSLQGVRLKSRGDR